MTIGPTTYARSPEGWHVAFQVVGAGPRNLVFVPGSFTCCDVFFEEPGVRRFVSSLGELGRLVVFDKRGTGLSDPVDLSAPPRLETWMDDVTTVIDSLGIERASLVGLEAGGQMALLYAATHPDRTEGLVLIDSFARLSADADYSIGLPVELQQYALEQVDTHWGEPVFPEIIMPTALGNDRVTEWYGRFQRMSASPATAVAILRSVFESDVRGVVPIVSVPTLVIHHQDNMYVDVEHGRWLAAHVPGAAYVELPGRDHFFWLDDADPVLDAVERFLPGSARRQQPDRVLCTVLFTDIVGSTERAASLGDKRWRDLLDRHDDITARAVLDHRGRVVKFTGDGALAVFDGPGRAVMAAQTAIRNLHDEGIDIRTGLHTGEVEQRGDDVGGIAIHLASRVCSVARSGEVLATRTIKDLVSGSGLQFEDRGIHTFKGISDEWQLLSVTQS